MKHFSGKNGDGCGKERMEAIAKKHGKIMKNIEQVSSLVSYFRSASLTLHAVQFIIQSKVKEKERMRRYHKTYSLESLKTLDRV